MQLEKVEHRDGSHQKDAEGAGGQQGLFQQVDKENERQYQGFATKYLCYI